MLEGRHTVENTSRKADDSCALYLTEVHRTCTSPRPNEGGIGEGVPPEVLQYMQLQKYFFPVYAEDFIREASRGRRIP